MRTKGGDTTVPSNTLLGEMTVALGGAPLGESLAAANEHSKRAHKRRKRDARLRHDAERPPNSFERYRILAEIIDEGRKVVDLADHKARYALVVIGVVNTGVFFLLSRAHLVMGVAVNVTPWLIGVLVVYAGLTFRFVFHAVDTLRPRQMRATGLAPDARQAGHHGALGLLHWETVAQYELGPYRRAWGTVRMEELNAELVLIEHHLSRLIRAKYIALERLYRGLGLLLLLAGVQLVAYAAFALMLRQA
jgi:hypothetical protein